MPAPGSAHALVLTSSTPSSDEALSPGERATQLLGAFFDPKQYTAVAIVHGLGRSAPRAFDLAKQRLGAKRGVIWVPDPDLLEELSGPDAKHMRRALKAQKGKLMTFYAPLSGASKAKWSLHWAQVNLATIDEGFLQAGLDQ